MQPSPIHQEWKDLVWHFSLGKEGEGRLEVRVELDCFSLKVPVPRRSTTHLQTVVTPGLYLEGEEKHRAVRVKAFHLPLVVHPRPQDMKTATPHPCSSFNVAELYLAAVVMATLSLLYV